MSKDLEALLRQEADWQDTDYEPSIEPDLVRQAADQLERYRVALEGVFAAVGQMTAPEGHPIHKAFETARQALEAK